MISGAAHFWRRVERFLKQSNDAVAIDTAEKGQGLVEYALILVLVVLVAFVVVTWIGPWIGNIFSNVITNL